jgi:hypothetical protein
VGGTFGDPRQDVAQPDLRVEVVQFGSDDQAVYRCGALATALGISEQP